MTDEMIHEKWKVEKERLMPPTDFLSFWRMKGQVTGGIGIFREEDKYCVEMKPSLPNISRNNY